MKKFFINVKLAMLAKAKGFKEPCLGFYNTASTEMDFISAKHPADFNDLSYVRTFRTSPDDDIVSAPLCDQLKNWFEEVHNLEITTTRLTVNSKTFTFTVTQLDKIDYDIYTSMPDCPLILETGHKEYPTREIALNEAFEYCFKIIL